MNGWNSIVAAVDFSSSSSQVLAHGARLAAATDAGLVAAHAVSESGVRDWEDAMGLVAPVEGRVRDLARRMEELLADSCGGVVADIDVRIGNPRQVLTQIVKDRDAGLLLMGAHDLRRRRLGSVASHCARSVPADVLLLRDWQTRYFRKIAVGVDFSAQSCAALEKAIFLAKIHGAALEVIHVIFPPNRDPWGRVMDQPMCAEVNYESAVRNRARTRLKALLEPLGNQLSGIPLETVFLEAESPAAAITAHVDVFEIDLTVMGSRQDSWVGQFILGSNTERLIQDSASSVLIVRG